MWTRFAFLLIALAAASAEYGWKSGQQYTYKVTSKTLTGLQTAPQYTGLVFKADLVIRANSEQELVAVIEHPQKAEIHTLLQKGHEFEIPQENLQFQSFALTKQPFIIRLKESIVDEVVISKEVPIWEVNVIKSIVSQLQVDTQGKRTIRSQMNMIPQENDLTAVYKTMEDTIEGECEVLYDISPLPKYILQRKPYLAPLYELTKEEKMFSVVKTKNFTNCNHRPGYHYGITGMTQWEPAANKMGNFLSRSSVSRIILSGNLKTYTIHSSETTNKVTVTSELGSGEQSSVLSRVNLTLVSVTPTQQQVQQPTHPQTIRNLVYSYNHPTKNDQEARQQWDQQNELHRRTLSFKEKNRLGRPVTKEGNNMNQKYSSDSSSSESSSISVESWHQETPKLTTIPQNPFLPYFVGCKGHSIQQFETVNVQQVVKKLCEQIGTQLQEPNHVPQASTLERFSILVRVIRNMDVQQLKKVTEELGVKQESENNVQNPRTSYWTVFRDAVAQAGTGPALMTIKEWISTDKIHGEEAAEVVASLTHSTMHPTSEYMKTFFEIVRHQKVVSQKYLNTSAIYSFTKLVRLSQVDRKTIHNRYPVHVFGRFTPHDDKIVAEEFIPYFGAKLQQAVQEEDTPKILAYIRALGNMAHPKILSVFEPYLEGQLPMSDFQRTLIVVSLNDLAKTHPRIARSVLYKIFSNLGEIHQVRVAAVYNLMKTVPPVNMLQRMAEATHDDPSIQVRSAIKSAIESAALLKNVVNIQLRRNAQAAVNMLTSEVFGIQYSRKNITDFILKDLNYGYTDTLSYIGSEDSNFPSALFYGIRTQIYTYQRKYFKAGMMVSSVQDMVDFIMSIFSVSENETNEQADKDQATTEWSYDKITKMLNVEHELMKQVEGTILFRLAGAERFFTFDNHTIEAFMRKLYQLPYTLAMGPSLAYQKLYNSHNYQVAFPTATGFPFVFTLETPRLLLGRGKIQVNAPKMSGSKNHLAEISSFPGMVNVQGVYSSRTQSKVGFITPFDHKHYVTGIHQEHQINVPVKMDVNVNLENFKVKLDIQPYDKTGDFKVFQFKTDKYTTIEDITEFKPVTEGSNTKRIQIRQPQKFQQVIGEKNGLGLRVEVESQKRHFDWKNLQMAWQRHNMISALVFSTAGETVENSKIDVYYDKTFARSFSINMAAYGPRDNGKNRKKEVNSSNQPTAVQEVFAEIQRGIQSPEAVAVSIELDIQGQSQHSATFGYGYSPVAEETKFVTRYLKQGGQQPYHVCLNVATKMSFVPDTDFSKAIENHPKGQVSAEVRFGENGCQNGAHVSVAGKFERTPERTEYLKNLPQAYSCNNEMKNDNKLLSGCMNATFNANLLNRYILTVKYDKVPIVAKNITYQMYSFFRQLGYPYVSEKWNSRETGQEKKIDFDVHFSPDLKSVSAQVTSPLGSAYFQNVRVNKYYRSALVMHPTMNILQRFGWSALRQQYDDFCTVDKTNVNTFDNVTYPIHLTNHWIPVFVSVPKIDQEGQFVGVHKVAVLAKEVSGNKEITIYTTGNSNDFSAVVHLKPLSDTTVAVTVNGQETKLQQGGKPFEYFDKNGNLIMRAFTVSGHEVRLKFPECNFNILYAMSRFQIFADETYKNRVLGLCGDYNGERFDYVTPKGKFLREPEEFVASWALTNTEPYSQLKERAEKNAVSKTVLFTGVVSDQDAGRTDKRGRQYTQEQQLQGYYDSSSSSSSESNEHNTECMAKRIMVIERDGKHCFSTNSQPSCKTGCQVEKTKPMTAKFICVNKTQTSSHWAQMVTQGAQLNLGEKLNNVQELTFQAPTECSKI